MHYAWSLILIVAGSYLLYRGARLLITYATKLSQNLGVPIAVVGLTVVAFGTSMPELIVGIFSSLGGHGSLVIGNVFGSNMANVGLALGLIILISRRPRADATRRFQAATLILAAVLMAALALDGELSRIDGGILVLASIVFSILAVRYREASTKVTQAVELALTMQRRREIPFNLLAIGGGVGLLLVGARLIVDNGIALAQLLSIPEIVIGLTIVAFGTSLPEIAAAIVTARKGESELGIANIMGSNIQNLLIVIGIPALIRPIPLGQVELTLDLPVMVVVSVALAGLVLSPRRLWRWHGATIVSLYLAYVIATVSSH
jgi:cation:H+ antiporter